DPDGEGWHVDRAEFDATMARKAGRAGATVLTGYEVRSCGLDRGFWSVEITGRRGDRRIQAPTLIDAAGRGPWRGRPSRRWVFDRQVAMIATFEIDGGDAGADRRTWIEAAPAGWWYSAAVPGHRLVVGYFTDADLLGAPARNLPGIWERLLHETR